MKKPYNSLRVFENPWLEKLTHVHPLTPLILWGPIVAWLYHRAFVVHELSVMSFVALWFTGVFAWTLGEYCLHRFLFHFDGKSTFAKRLHFLIHGIHHDDPNDATRLVMPPFGSITLGLLFYGLFVVCMGEAIGETFFSAFVTGYLFYDYIHYATHHFRPRTRVGKYLKQSHMIHHFVDPDSRWGVSSPFWDIVFGTYHPATKTSQKVADKIV